MNDQDEMESAAFSRELSRMKVPGTHVPHWSRTMFSSLSEAIVLRVKRLLPDTVVGPFSHEYSSGGKETFVFKVRSPSLNEEVTVKVPWEKAVVETCPRDLPDRLAEAVERRLRAKSKRRQSKNKR